MSHPIPATGLSASHVKNQTNNSTERNRLISHPPSARAAPGFYIMQCFSRLPFVRAVAHPGTKAISGAMVTAGMVTAYLGEFQSEFVNEHLNPHLGKYLNVYLIDIGAALGGTGSFLWTLSTILSSAMLERGNKLADHIAYAIGYGAAGIPLMLFDSCLSSPCCAKNWDDTSDSDTDELALSKAEGPPVIGDYLEPDDEQPAENFE